MKVMALIGDIVDSKQLARRGEFQTKLAAVLRSVSTRNPALASPYTITLGDEFQAVYRSPDPLFTDIFAIMAEIHPVQARFAVGLGALSTGINKKQALGMDGPAFHRAREAITALKGTPYLIRLQGEPAARAGEGSGRLLLHLLNVLSHQIGGWSQNRLRIMHGLLAGKTVLELEKELRISKVAVYKNINAATLADIKGLCDEITRLLKSELTA